MGAVAGAFAFGLTVGRHVGRAAAAKATRDVESSEDRRGVHVLMRVLRDMIKDCCLPDNNNTETLTFVTYHTETSMCHKTRRFHTRFHAAIRPTRARRRAGQTDDRQTRSCIINRRKTVAIRQDAKLSLNSRRV